MIGLIYGWIKVWVVGMEKTLFVASLRDVIEATAFRRRRSHEGSGKFFVVIVHNAADGVVPGAFGTCITSVLGLGFAKILH